MRGLASALLLALFVAPAQACLFLRDVPREQWHAWASVLFTGEVTGLAREGALDVIEVRIADTLKGPQGERATVRVPARMWESCRMARPGVGARVLVGLNPQGDAAIVPTNGGPPGASGAASGRQ